MYNVRPQPRAQEQGRRIRWTLVREVMMTLLLVTVMVILVEMALVLDTPS